MKNNIINNIEELKKYLKKEGIITSKELQEKGIKYWNKIYNNINKKLIIKIKNKQEFDKILKDNYPLLLLDISEITDLSNLFSLEMKNKKFWKEPLNYIGFWNTKNVKNMNSCLAGQKFFNQKLYWNTEKVETMEYMFCGCNDFNQEINFNVNNCKHFEGMFLDCIKFNSKVNLISNTKKFCDYMFYNCIEFNNIININNVISSNNMFYNCVNFNQKITFYCEDNYNMFKGCRSLNIKNIGIYVKKQGINFLKENYLKFNSNEIIKIENKLKVLEI